MEENTSKLSDMVSFISKDAISDNFDVFSSIILS